MTLIVGFGFGGLILKSDKERMGFEEVWKKELITGYNLLSRSRSLAVSWDSSRRTIKVLC